MARGPSGSAGAGRPPRAAKAARPRAVAEAEATERVVVAAAAEPVRVVLPEREAVRDDRGRAPWPRSRRPHRGTTRAPCRLERGEAVLHGEGRRERLALARRERGVPQLAQQHEPVLGRVVVVHKVRERVVARRPRRRRARRSPRRRRLRRRLRRRPAGASAGAASPAPRRRSRRFPRGDDAARARGHAHARERRDHIVPVVECVVPTHAARRAIPTSGARGSAPRARARASARSVRHGALGRRSARTAAAPRAAASCSLSRGRAPWPARQCGVVVGERVRGERGVELGARRARRRAPRARRAGSQGTARSSTRGVLQPRELVLAQQHLAVREHALRAGRLGAQLRAKPRKRSSSGSSAKPGSSRATSAQKAADVNAAWSSSLDALYAVPYAGLYEERADAAASSASSLGDHMARQVQWEVMRLSAA